MADDNGLYADIEQGFIAAIAAIELDAVVVFAAVDSWQGQIKSLRDFQTSYPFAYVRCHTSKSAGDEGGEMSQTLTVDVEVGTYIATGSARIGIGVSATDKELGYSRLRDLVTAALNGVFVSTTKANIEFPQYRGDRIVVDVSETGKEPFNCCKGTITFDVKEIGV